MRIETEIDGKKAIIEAYPDQNYRIRSIEINGEDVSYYDLEKDQQDEVDAAVESAARDHMDALDYAEDPYDAFNDR